MVEYIALGTAALIGRIIYKRNEEKIKGYFGEKKLERKLKKLKIPGKVKVLRDALLPTRHNTSQVDALAVTRYGIIVCEMKNYSAKIFGAVDQKDWTVKYPNGAHSLYNPVFQNRSHIRAINDIIQKEFPRMTYLPLAVFSDEATLHVQNSRNKVCNLKDLHKVIQRQLGPEILSDAQVERISSILEKSMIKDRQAKKNHITAIQLTKEFSKNVNQAEVNAFKQVMLRQAEEKPVVSTADPFSAAAKNFSEDNTPVPPNNRPLREVLQNAQRRQAEAQQEGQGHQPTVSNQYYR